MQVDRRPNDFSLKHVVFSLCFFSVFSRDTAAHWLGHAWAQSDSWSFCGRVRLAYESDIILGLHSSHMLVEILFARPGSVIIDISTFNFVSLLAALAPVF